MRVLILDGYTDEPAGLGVPPYIGVYPRYIAGAVWAADKSATVHYVTVDDARRDISSFISRASTYDLVVVIAGVVVPGRYLGGKPITPEELDSWFRVIEGPVKVLAGPAARFGMGVEGGRVAELPEKVKACFDVLVKGDPEAVVYDIVRYGVERADPCRLREGYEEIDRYAVLGAKIIEQHPCLVKGNLVVELETFRGCPKACVMNGCSFCVEQFYGFPEMRPPESIVKEVEALHCLGARHFRLGKQPDILSYMASGIGETPFPKPNPEALRRLFHGVRSAAPQLKVLHIDNVNPGTLAHNPREAEEALKVIVEYHTPGDVAAMGIETADPRVVRANNLKVYPDEALEAIRIVNKVGARRGWNGLPELLPGINFVCGLLGETRETYRLNLEFLQRILDEGLMVRRVNVRQVIALPGTPMWSVGDAVIRKHKALFKSFRERVMRDFDKPMLRRIAPKGTVLRYLFSEAIVEGRVIARQPGSYPLAVELPPTTKLGVFLDAVVIDHGSKSVEGLPLPVDVNRAPIKQLAKLLGRKAALELARRRPVKSLDDVSDLLGPYKDLFTAEAEGS